VRSSQPPPAASGTALAAPASARALVAQDRIVVLGAAKVPGSLQVDGQLTEWPIFAGGTATPLTPSFVVVAATADSLVLVGRVRNLPEQGLWLRLESGVPAFPPIGTLQRGGGIDELQCDVAEASGAATFDPETCHALLSHYDELQKSFTALFVRQLHLTAQALTVRAGEQEQALSGAKYAFRASEGAVTFEAVLPLSALPSTASPDLSELLVTPERAAAGPPREATTEVAQSVRFGEPIRFGMDSELLGCLFQAAGNNPVVTTPRFAYQPGVPNRVYRAQNVRGLEIEMSEVPLSVHEGGLNSIEVRTVPGAWPRLAVIKDGQLIECPGVGNVLGVVKRGLGLHVISYSQDSDESVNLDSASFSVLEIDKNGTLHEDLLETLETGFGYMSVGQAHEKNLASFSIKGIYRTNEGGGQEHTLSWRYNAKLNRYGLTQRNGRHVAPPE